MAFLDPNISNEEVKDFSILPEGTYDITINKIELKKTASGGEMLSVTLKVTSEKGRGRMIFDNINIVNQNPTAQEIGRRTLTMLRILAGIGERELTNTDQLIGAKGIAMVGIEKQEGRAPKNKVMWYRPANDAVMGAKSTTPEFEGFCAPAPIKKTEAPSIFKEEVYQPKPVKEAKPAAAKDNSDVPIWAR